MAAKVYIAGGFGNLLFQYIGIKYLQKKGINKITVKNTLVSNSVLTRMLRWYIHEDYSHLIFDEENIIQKRFRILDILSLLSLKISKSINKPFLGAKYVHTNENSISSKHCAYMGYFQNLNIYSNDFYIWADGLGLKLKVKSPEKRISVHFRFGDSVWVQNHNDYYHKVVNELRDVDDVVYVVSDDHEKAQQILNNTGICYEIFSSSMIEEFLFLAESEICFCAPSTFSWWASIINIRHKTRIVMPQYLGKRFPLKEDSIQFL